MQPPAPVAMPQAYAYSEPASGPTLPANSLGYGFSLVTSQNSTQADSEAMQRDREDGELEPDYIAHRVEEKPSAEESNAYRPDFSSIIQEPMDPSSMCSTESSVLEKRRVDLFVGPEGNPPTYNGAVHPEAQHARAPQSKTTDRAASHSPNVTLPPNGSTASSQTLFKGGPHPERTS